jgi:8-oxo-dGTP pyrophosphatase MutT (NUDIX family)
MAKDLEGLIGQDEARQCGALCWRMHHGRIEVLLISSRDTGRWVIPKGWPIDGLNPAETAAREAWEEAGVNGVIDPQATGSFFYLKAFNRRTETLPCEVSVFALRVAKIAAKFPEKKERRRRWFTAVKAAKLVHEAGLSSLLLAFSPTRPAAKSALAAR